MPQKKVLLIASACWPGTLAGCAGLSGDWEAVRIEPESGAAAVHFISFDGDGAYAASGCGPAGTKTESGRYKWNGRTLRLEPEGVGPRLYEGRISADGTLRLTDPSAETQVTVTFQRR